MSDEEWMIQALASGGKGSPSPNPHVGAIVVSNGRVVGVGHHEKAGDEHAEVVALRNAGPLAKGATLYVTLEPCNHTGRTPPCTEAIAQAEIARVVVGAKDPNPHVKGGGIESLRAKGILVDMGPKQAESLRLIAPWAKFVTTGLPFVALKLALTLDGRIATRTGASKWVTGAVARAKVHAIRAKHDAVAVGIGTVLSDDPRLTVRDVPGRSPPRIVVDTSLRLPLSSRLVTSAQDVPTWVVTLQEHQHSTHAEELRRAGVRFLTAERSAEGRIDIRSALTVLGQANVVSLMVEGGAELAGSLLAGEFADELHAFVAPLLFGPRGRAGAVDWAGPALPGEAPRIREPVWELCGHDAYVHGAIQYGPPAA